MTRQRLGTTLLCVAAFLAFVTYLAWSFSTQSELKAQLMANAQAAAIGEPPPDIQPNRTPPSILGVTSVVVLLAGVVLRKPGPEPRTALPTAFWGRPEP